MKKILIPQLLEVKLTFNIGLHIIHSTIFRLFTKNMKSSSITCITPTLAGGLCEIIVRGIDFMGDYIAESS